MRTFELGVILCYMLLIAVSIGISLYKGYWKKMPYLPLTAALATTLLVESLGYYNILTKNKVAGWLFPLFLPVQYVLLAFYFRSIIQKKNVRNLILISIPLLLTWNVFNTLYIQSLDWLNTNAILVACLLYCAWSSLYLLQLLESPSREVLWHSPNFWICTGTLFFYSSSFFIISFIHFIFVGNNTLASQVWLLVRIFNIILYGLYVYGFICQTKRQKSP